MENDLQSCYSGIMKAKGGEAYFSCFPTQRTGKIRLVTLFPQDARSSSLVLNQHNKHFEHIAVERDKIEMGKTC